MFLIWSYEDTKPCWHFSAKAPSLMSEILTCVYAIKWKASLPTVHSWIHSKSAVYTEKEQLNDKPAMTNAQRENYSSLHLKLLKWLICWKLGQSVFSVEVNVSFLLFWLPNAEKYKSQGLIFRYQITQLDSICYLRSEKSEKYKCERFISFYHGITPPSLLVLVLVILIISFMDL